jgi:putative peptidoglycan lipid II flippase
LEDSTNLVDSDASQAAPRLLGSATVLAGGNVASRILGLVREQVIASQWGGGLESSAFTAAARVPTLIYDLLVGGMLSAALVPVLSSYAAKDRAEFWRVAGVVVSLASLASGLAAVLVFAFAGPIAQFLGAGFGPRGEELVFGSLRYLTPAVALFGIAGVLNGLLYALERFTLPAATGAVYNLGFIVAALAFHERLGVYALPLGISLGAVAQVAVLLPGLRDGGLRLRLSWHPALGRIFGLYIPIAAGLAISAVQVGVEPRLASQWGAEGLSWMRFATTLIQLPHGLIAIAISAAILPRLAATHARGQDDEFASTLARGLRAVTGLTLPAVVGLAVLAEPVVGLVFQRGAFDEIDRMAVALALYPYLAGLPFAAIDWPLNYAFYARQNTVVPALVGVVSVGVWFAAALTLPAAVAARTGSLEAGYLGLVAADTAKHAAHALIMLALVARVTRGAGLADLFSTVWRAGLAAAAMGLAVATVDGVLVSHLQPGATGWAVRCGIGVGLGVMVYATMAAVVGLHDVQWLMRQVRAKLRLL